MSVRVHLSQLPADLRAAVARQLGDSTASGPEPRPPRRGRMNATETRAAEPAPF